MPSKSRGYSGSAVRSRGGRGGSSSGSRGGGSRGSGARGGGFRGGSARGEGRGRGSRGGGRGGSRSGSSGSFTRGMPTRGAAPRGGSHSRGSSPARGGRGGSARPASSSGTPPLDRSRSSSSVNAEAGNRPQNASQTAPKRPRAASASSASEMQVIPDGEPTNPPQKRVRRDLIDTAKPFWTQAKRKEISAESRKAAMNSLIQICIGHSLEIAVQPVGARMLCTVVKHGSEENLRHIWQELQPKWIDMCKDKYAYHIFGPLYRNSNSALREEILQSMKGHVLSVLQSNYGRIVVEDICPLLNEKQMTFLASEFYGPYYALFSSKSAKSLVDLMNQMYDANAKGGKKTASSDSIVWDAAQKDLMLRHVFTQANKLTEKMTLHCPLVHHFLNEVIQIANRSQMEQLMESLRDHLIQILHTRPGSTVATQVISFSSPSDRKKIARTFKTYVRKIAKDDEGYLVLLRMLDVTDDTVMLKKVILKELLSSDEASGNSALSELANHKYGRLLFLNLFARNSTKYLSARAISLLGPLGISTNPYLNADAVHKAAGALAGLPEPTPAVENATEKTKQPLSLSFVLSRKDSDTRVKELLGAVWPRLVTLYSDPNAVRQALLSPYGCSVYMEAMMAAPEAHRVALASTLAAVLSTDMNESTAGDTRAKKPSLAMEEESDEERVENVAPKVPSSKDYIHTDLIATVSVKKLIKHSDWLANAAFDGLKENLFLWASKPFACYVALALLEHPKCGSQCKPILSPHVAELEALADTVRAVPAMLNVLKPRPKGQEKGGGSKKNEGNK